MKKWLNGNEDFTVGRSRSSRLLVWLSRRCSIASGIIVAVVLGLAFILCTAGRSALGQEDRFVVVSGIVVAVHSGDTFVLEVEERRHHLTFPGGVNVRLIEPPAKRIIVHLHGVEASPIESSLGVVATRRLSEMLLGQRVSVFGPPGSEQKGVVGIVFVESDDFRKARMVNHELLRQRIGRFVEEGKVATQWDHSLARASEASRNERNGIWALGQERLRGMSP